MEHEHILQDTTQSSGSRDSPLYHFKSLTQKTHVLQVNLILILDLFVYLFGFYGRLFNAESSLYI